MTLYKCVCVRGGEEVNRQKIMKKKCFLKNKKHLYSGSKRNFKIWAMGNYQRLPGKQSNAERDIYSIKNEVLM